MCVIPSTYPLLTFLQASSHKRAGSFTGMLGMSSSLENISTFAFTVPNPKKTKQQILSLFLSLWEKRVQSAKQAQVKNKNNNGLDSLKVFIF